MTEYKYLRVKQNEEEKRGLLEKTKHETTPEEAKALLERMLEISGLIRDVSLFPPF